MNEARLKSATAEIESLRRLHRCCPLLDYEINKLNSLAKMLMRHGGDFSHPMLCEKSRKIDELTLIACRSYWL